MQLIPKPIQLRCETPSEDSIKRKKLYWNLLCLGIEGDKTDNNLLDMLLIITNNALVLKRAEAKRLKEQE